MVYWLELMEVSQQGAWAGVFLICRLFSLSVNGRVFVIVSHCTVLGVVMKSSQDGHVVYIIIIDMTNLCACFFLPPCVCVCVSSLGPGHWIFLGCCVYIHLVACPDWATSWVPMIFLKCACHCSATMGETLALGQDCFCFVVFVYGACVLFTHNT